MALWLFPASLGLREGVVQDAGVGVLILVPPLESCVASGQSLHLSGPPSAHPVNGLGIQRLGVELMPFRLSC